MGVGAAHAEGADPGTPGDVQVLVVFEALPGLSFVDEVEGAVVQVHVGADLGAVQVGRELPVPQTQEQLEQPGDARGRLQVPDVGLHRAQAAVGFGGGGASGAGVELGEALLQAVDLDGVSQGGARAVGFDEAHRGRVEAGLFIGGHQQLRLGCGVGRGEGARSAAVVHRGAADHRVDGIVVGQGRPQRLEHHCPHTLTADVAVGSGAEGLATPFGRQHARLAEGEEQLRGKEGRHAAGDGHFALSGEQGSSGPMQRHQGAGAGRVHHLAGAVDVQ